MPPKRDHTGTPLRAPIPRSLVLPRNDSRNASIDYTAATQSPLSHDILQNFKAHMLEGRVVLVFTRDATTKKPVLGPGQDASRMEEYISYNPQVFTVDFAAIHPARKGHEHNDNYAWIANEANLEKCDPFPQLGEDGCDNYEYSFVGFFDGFDTANMARRHFLDVACERDQKEQRAHHRDAFNTGRYAQPGRTCMGPATTGGGGGTTTTTTIASLTTTTTTTLPTTQSKGT